MRKIILSIILSVAIFAGVSTSYKFIGITISPKIVWACINWGTPERKCFHSNINGVCDGGYYWETPCDDPPSNCPEGDAGCTGNVICGEKQYACNSGWKCCDVNTGDVVGGGGGGGSGGPGSCPLAKPQLVSPLQGASFLGIPSYLIPTWSANSCGTGFWVNFNGAHFNYVDDPYAQFDPDYFAGLAENTTYNWSVCAAYGSNGATNCSDTWTFSTGSYMNGTVYSTANIGYPYCKTAETPGIPNATITFNSSEGYPPVSATTDANGHYGVWVVSPGTYNVTFSGVSYTGTPASCGWGSTTIKLTSNGFTYVSDFGLNAQVNVNPWWQVKDSDVESSGDLSSKVPSGNKFDLDGDGGYPGIPAYGGSTNLTNANVSSKGWIANSTIKTSNSYSYNSFAKMIPDNILSIMNSQSNQIVDPTNASQYLTSASATPDSNGYYWFKYDGSKNGGLPLTIPAVNLGTRKVILLVNNANLDITGDINLTKGQGFFMTVVNGNIVVDSSVGGEASPNLEGLYFADGTFSDGTGNTQLWTRGSVVANGGVTMQRDLETGNANPAEYFEYAPDQIMLYPKALAIHKMKWKEVAP